jgi:hypothetical protein
MSSMTLVPAGGRRLQENQIAGIRQHGLGGPAERRPPTRRGHRAARLGTLARDREAVDALTPTLDHIVIDRGEQVRDDAEAIKLLSKRVPVVAFVNNHFAGFASETLRQLAALLA